MDNMQEAVCYDSYLIKPLAKLGWKVQEVSWQSTNPKWDQFDAVIIRSTWNYQDHCQEFLKVLKEIEESKAVLLNCRDLVAWNINKKYLKELEENNVCIVPTLWEENYSKEIFETAKTKFKSKEYIIKPCVSAGSFDTFRLNEDVEAVDHEKLAILFKNREFMIQPFMSTIIEGGEYSLFFFNGEYSHAIVKKPKENDFRVQEEFGGQLTLITPEEELLASAKVALQAIPYGTLYARMDFVKINSNSKGKQFALMEAELIEPSLYFYLDEKSAERFALAFDSYFNLLVLK